VRCWRPGSGIPFQGTREAPPPSPSHRPVTSGCGPMRGQRREGRTPLSSLSRGFFIGTRHANGRIINARARAGMRWLKRHGGISIAGEQARTCRVRSIAFGNQPKQESHACAVAARIARAPPAEVRGSGRGEKPVRLPSAAGAGHDGWVLAGAVPEQRIDTGTSNGGRRPDGPCCCERERRASGAKLLESGGNPRVNRWWPGSRISSPGTREAPPPSPSHRPDPRGCGSMGGRRGEGVPSGEPEQRQRRRSHPWKSRRGRSWFCDCHGGPSTRPGGYAVQWVTHQEEGASLDAGIVAAGRLRMTSAVGAERAPGARAAPTEEVRSA